MTPAPPRPTRVLVTGLHHSATTVVGEVLAAGSGRAYLYEPFNLHKTLSHSEVIFDRWYTYLTKDTDARILDGLDTIIFAKHVARRVAAKFGQVQRPSDLLRLLRFVLISGRIRAAREALIIKDPIALLSAGFLADRYGLRVVQLLRHPCGFVEAILRRKSRFPIAHLTGQTSLMADHLEPWRHRLAEAEAADDALVEAATVWAALNDMALRRAEADPRFLVVRHEDIATDPDQMFGTISAHCGLAVTAAIEAAMRERFRQGGASDARVHKADKHYTRRDPAVATSKWRARLTEQQIAAIWGIAGPVAAAYYPAP